MASRPGSAPQQQPQFSLPPHTPEQLYVQRKQAEEIQKDVLTLASQDMTRPFTNLQDAVMRLLPFHLFNQADPGLADLDDTPDHIGEDLMASRHQAWEELSMDKANDLRKRAAATANSIAELEARMTREALSGTNNIDQYAVAKLQQEDLRKKINTDKAELQKLLPPAPAPAAAAAASSAGKASQAAGAAAASNLLGQLGSHAALQAAAAARIPSAGRGQQPLLVPAAATMNMQQQLLLAQQQALQQYQQRQAFLMLQQQQQQQAGAQQGQVPQLTPQQLLQQHLLQQQLLQQQPPQTQLLLARIAAQQQQQQQLQQQQQQQQRRA